MFFHVFCFRSAVTCFIADLLRRSVLSLTISFFMGFYVDNSNGKIKSNLIRQYAINMESYVF